jgi:hypothetical protein
MTLPVESAEFAQLARGDFHANQLARKAEQPSESTQQ